jgi:hypothetical protein
MNVKFYDLYFRDAVATAMAPFSKDYKIVGAGAVGGTIIVDAVEKGLEASHRVKVYMRLTDGKLLFTCSDEDPR